MIKRWFSALRVKHWIKNFFVLAPFLISAKFGVNEYLVLTLTGVALFCMASSAIYLFNDVVDLRFDKHHPVKSKRPIASGEISAGTAITVSALLLILALIASYLLNLKFFLLLVAYVANNLLYTFYLKKKTVLDVISIAVGFVLRVFAGGYIIDIEITKWLVTCVFSLSLVFGFGKRRTEYQDLKDDASLSREVQVSYSVEKLNLLLAISSSVTIVAYMLYTMAPETRELHGTDNILFTTPFVVYAVYRYMLKVQEDNTGGPVELMLRDRGFLLAGFLWLVTFLSIVHA
jgi:4-hydroxybenzoate polyprenyltransferase